MQHILEKAVSIVTKVNGRMIALRKFAVYNNYNDNNIISSQMAQLSFKHRNNNNNNYYYYSYLL